MIVNLMFVVNDVYYFLDLLEPCWFCLHLSCTLNLHWRLIKLKWHLSITAVMESVFSTWPCYRIFALPDRWVCNIGFEIAMRIFLQNWSHEFDKSNVYKRQQAHNKSDSYRRQESRMIAMCTSFCSENSCKFTQNVRIAILLPPRRMLDMLEIAAFYYTWENAVIPIVSLSFPDSKVHVANMGPTGSCRPQVGPMLAPWTLLQGCSVSR